MELRELPDTATRLYYGQTASRALKTCAVRCSFFIRGPRARVGVTGLAGSLVQAPAGRATPEDRGASVAVYQERSDYRHLPSFDQPRGIAIECRLDHVAAHPVT
ncbi:MAG: hypothetical protein CM15mP84_00500 [Cellvibrionales bacterium]|nr:MAG: hypothetical protein CM15mP84_00500 [Cellvibrionales bacterium]